MPAIAIVGCAHIHTPGFVNTLKKRGDVQVRYVYDAERARAAFYAGELAGSELIEQPAAVWNDRTIEGVVICSQTGQHEPLVTAAAAAGKHVFAEKPLGLGAADSFRMAAAVERAGVRFQTGYFNRCNPAYRFIRDLVQQGKLGRITRVRGCNVHQGALGGWFDAKPQDPAHDWRWMADPALAGCGAFGDLGTHLLDILMWIVGDVARVTADIQSVTGRYGPCDETGEALIAFESGTVGTLTGAWLDHANPVPLLVSGTEGHAYVCNGQLFVQCKNLPGADGKSPWTELPPALPHAFELFLDALSGKDVPLVGVREAASRVAVMEAMYSASASKTWVAPKKG